MVLWTVLKIKFCKMIAVFFDKFFMWLKGERAVFRQILAGDPFKAQICHLGLKSGPLEAKMVRFEAKNDRFEAKRVTWTVLEVKFGKMISAFFL